MANCTQQWQTWLGVAACMSFDGLAHNDSRRLFRVAVGCLGEHDWHLRAMLLPPRPHPWRFQLSSSASPRMMPSGPRRKQSR